MSSRTSKSRTGAAAPSKKPGQSTFGEWAKAIVFSVLFVVTFRGVVAQAYQIPTGSMENTLLVGDYLFVNKMLYGSEIDVGLGGKRLFHCRFPAIREPRRGDVIVFRSPEHPRQDLIKRCVAVAGQTIRIRDKVL